MECSASDECFMFMNHAVVLLRFVRLFALEVLIFYKVLLWCWCLFSLFLLLLLAESICAGLSPMDDLM